MRFATVLSVLALILPGAVMAQSGLSVSNYQLQSSTPVSGSVVDETYSGLLFNAGSAYASVAATLTSNDSNIVVLPGRNVLNFSPVPATTVVTSSNTFTIRVDRSQTVFFSQLRWSFSTVGIQPIANAGPDQTAAHFGQTVNLNGTGSTNPSGQGTLTYSWAFVTVPNGSTAVLNNANTATPSFIVNPAGQYVIKLIVSNGLATSTATVTVNATNTAPVANAGPDQTITRGASVQLNGTGSTDVDGNSLAYSWIFLTRPSGSTATLSNANTSMPFFSPDKVGDFVVQLIVSDSILSSIPDTVTISYSPVAPVANAGPSQNVIVGTLVHLTGAGSTDVNGNSLTYQWSLLSKPAGSSAVLSSITSVAPSFTADVSGTYIAQLIVSNGLLNSTPSVVTVSTNAIQPPTANAGPDQTVSVGGLVTIAGVGTDPQSLPLSKQYSLLTKPAGSTAAIVLNGNGDASFTADKAGNYVVQLTVNNGTLSSTPDTVTISTGNTAPVANPGAGFSRAVGATVQLDGAGSTDAEGDSLTYSWTFSSKPDGSVTTLSGATTATPSFIADLAGTYVVQLIVNDGHLNSTPQTVTIIVVPANSMAFNPNPVNMTTGAPVTVTVTLAQAATGAGTTITLTTQTASASPVTFPSTVFFEAGAIQKTFTLTPVSTGSVTIVGVAPAGGLQPANLQVNVAGQTIAVTLDTSVLGIGNHTTGHVTLATATPGDITVTLAADSANVVLPASVQIAKGGTSATFDVQGVAVGNANITASASGYTSGGTSVLVSLLGQINLPANLSLSAGQAANFPVSISSPAGPGGVTVSLSSSNPSAATINLNSVFIPANSTAPATNPVVTAVGFGSTNIVASAQGYQGLTRTVTVGSTLGWAQVLIAGGINTTQTASVVLSTAAAAPLTVNLTSDTPGIASVPASVTIAAGATSAPVAINLGSAGNTTIRANAAGLVEAPISVIVASFGNIHLPANQFVSVGTSVAFPVSISQAAPAGGVTIQLASSDSSKVTIAPSTVTIAVGQTTPAVQPQISGVQLGTANIQASGPGLTGTAQSVAITAPATLTPQSLTINGSGVQNLTLNLGAPAPAALTVQLTSNSPIHATVPASINIPAGATSAIVPVTPISSGPADITATPSAFYQPAMASIQVFIAVQGNIAVGTGVPVNLNMGQTLPLPISISPAAPAGGVTVNLASDNPAVTVTTSVFIAAGATTPTTLPTVTGSNFGGATITATAASYLAGTATAQVTAALAFGSAPLTISGTSTVSLVLRLPTSAPSPVTVNLASSNTAIASVPATATFAAGSSAVNVPVTGVAPGIATITASALGLTPASASVNITPSPDILLPAGVILGPGQDQLFPITLKTVAPAGGVYVALASSDASKVTVTPPLVFVPQGALTSIATPRVSGLDFGSAVIAATSPGMLGDSQTVQVAIQMSFVQPAISIPGVGTTQNLALSLTAPSPAGGATVNLTMSNPGVVTIPASIFIPANVSVVSIQVRGLAPGVTDINAEGGFVGHAKATVTVMAPGALSLGSNVTVPVGQYATLPVMLGSPALTDVTVTLTSANDRKLFVTSTVVIPAGATQPVSQPQVGATNIGTVAITASAPGYTPVTTNVQATTTISWNPTSLSMAPAEQRIVALALAIPAPPGHTAAGRCEIVDSDFCSTTIFLSSDNPAIAQVQPAITYYPDGSNPSTAQIIITGGGTAGTTTIHASALPYVQDVTLTVTVLGPNAIALPAGVTLTPGQGYNFNVTLSSPAPSGGVTVALASSDSSKVSISPASVFIQGGLTTPATQPQVVGQDFGSANITATAAGFATATQAVQVRGALTLSPQPLTLTSGNGSLTLTLSSQAPSPVTVTLTSSNPGVAAVASSVTINTGTTGVVVGVSTGSSGTAQITASAGPSITPATVNVTVGSVTLGGITLQAGLATTPGHAISMPLSLTSPAPAGGVTVTLSSANGVATVTPSVFIAQGATSPVVQPQVAGVQFGNASITANASGYTSATQTVSVGAALSFGSTTLSVARTASSNLQLILSAPAPAGGLTVTLTSSNPSVATVPASVTIPAAGTSVNVPVTGVALGTSTVSASGGATNVSGASAAITVTNPDIQVPANLAVNVGSTVQIPVTLAQPAPAGGIFVVLASNDTNKATVNPSTVFIAQGATAPVAQPSASGVGPGTVIITATSTGLVGSSASLVVTGGTTAAPGTIGLPANVVVPMGPGTPFPIALGTPAPPGGVTVSLTIGNTVRAAISPATVFIPAGATTPNVQPTIVSLNVGPNTVTASAPGYGSTSQTITSVATVQFVSGTTTTVSLGQTGRFYLALGAAAPPGTTPAGRCEQVDSDLCSISVNIRPDTPGIIYVQPALTYYPDGSNPPTALVLFAPIGVGTTTVHVGAAPYIPDAVITVTVTP